MHPKKYVTHAYICDLDKNFKETGIMQNMWRDDSRLLNEADQIEAIE